MRFLPILLLLGLSACHRKEIKSTVEPYTGYYEWYFSFRSGGITESQETQTDRYALHIKKQGRVEFIKNGKVFYQDRIYKTYNHPNGSIILYLGNEDSSQLISITNNEVRSGYFPFSGYTNQYIRTE